VAPSLASSITDDEPPQLTTTPIHAASHHPPLPFIIADPDNQQPLEHDVPQ
jgi:hypothetical protein